jgi:hypothetical protein
MIIFVIILGFLISLLPLAVPSAAIAVSIVVWPIVYVVIYFLSDGFDITQHLPWYIADPNRATVTLIVFMTIMGLVRGISGVLAMATIWIPFFLLPTYLLNLGVAVENPSGWIGYVFDNYQDDCSNNRGYYICKYTPIDGRKLPTFVQDNSVGTERVMSVTPYKKHDAVNNTVEKAGTSNLQCFRTVTESEGSTTTTETCYF